MNQDAEFRQWLTTLADHNLAQAIKHRTRHVAHGSLKEESGVLLFSIGQPSLNGHFNGLLPLDPQISPTAVISQGQEFFASLNVDHTIWIREHLDEELERVVQAEGYQIRRRPGTPGMFVQRPYDSITIPPGIEIRSVTTEADAQAFTAVVSSAFDIPQDTGLAVFASVAALNSPTVRAFVIHQREKTVATALTIVSGKVAGIYWVGTVAEARGQGLGELSTKVATNAGFELGAEVVILQASLAGEPIYRRIGYQTFTLYKWYSLAEGVRSSEMYSGLLVR